MNKTIIFSIMALGVIGIMSSTVTAERMYYFDEMIFLPDVCGEMHTPLVNISKSKTSPMFIQLNAPYVIDESCETSPKMFFDNITFDLYQGTHHCTFLFIENIWVQQSNCGILLEDDKKLIMDVNLKYMTEDETRYLITSHRGTYQLPYYMP